MQLSHGCNLKEKARRPHADVAMQQIMDVTHLWYDGHLAAQVPEAQGGNVNTINGDAA
jgi:hypothetical protein